jgi:1,5-anhydro-D-fructose reductase (1,5-anhydro-D-mannitol-forming)
MSVTINLGIIGLGAMGFEMLSVAAEHPDFNVLLCADIDSESVSRAKDNYPQIQFTTSPSDVIDSKEIEAIYIATPPIFHADYAIQAMRRNKAVFCEKPLAISTSDGETMVEVAKQTNVANALNFALADRHAALEIERALKAGRVGDVRGVDVRLLFPKWPRDFQAGADWLAGRQQGGFIREVFSHFAYLTDRLLGPLTLNFAYMEFPAENTTGSETFAYGLLNAGDVPISIIGQTGVAVPETYEWYLYGTRRSYCLRNWGELLVSDGEDWSNVALDGERGSERTRLTAFARAIRHERRGELPDFAAGLRALHIIEAFHRTEARSRLRH